MGYGIAVANLQLFYSNVLCVCLFGEQAAVGPATLQRGMKLLGIISAYGLVHEKNKQFIVYVITIVPHNSRIMWRVFRRYSAFENLRAELHKQVLAPWENFHFMVLLGFFLCVEPAFLVAQCRVC